MSWFVKCLKNYANFSGRARRKEFWFFVLFSFIIHAIASILDSMLRTTFGYSDYLGFDFPMGWIYSLVGLALIIPFLAVTVRRLHDTGKSGAWIFIYLVPLVGWIILLIFLLTDSHPGSNQYGPNPNASDHIIEQ